jgi:hypothetical protein
MGTTAASLRGQDQVSLVLTAAEAQETREPQTREPSMETEVLAGTDRITSQ